MQSSAGRAAMLDEVRRDQPAGLGAGAPLSRIAGPVQALALVAGELKQAEVHLHDLVHSDVAEVPMISRYLIGSGGKRLRPALTALGARACGLDTDVSRLMCVGELIHLGSLLHDDVVDGADMRRGRDAAHRVHGSAVTILTGDFCLARAVQLAAEDGGHTVVTQLSRAVTEMAEGEVLQLKRSGDLDCSLEDYLDVIDRKSAALIAWCVSAGALAKGDESAARALAAYGRAVGRAFQVTDDVLDYAEGTGKTSGADIRERKVTLPLLYAMRADKGLRGELDTVPSDDQTQALMQRVRDTGALERALVRARDWVDAGVGQLKVIPPSVHREALEELAHYLVERAK